MTPPARSPVLVTDGDERSALAVVRSLGASGHPVYVCATRRDSLAAASRHARGAAAVASPLADPTGFVADVRALVVRWDIRLLMPIGEASLLALLPERDRLGDVALPFADIEQFRAISDKERLLATAPSVGIAVPEQRVLATPDDARALDLGSVRFPVVLKPARSVGEHAGARAKLGVEFAADAPTLARHLAALPPAAFPLLLQQRVVGPGVGIFLLVWDGETVAEFAHRRIREKPPAGGVSVYRESIPADRDLVARSRALLDAFGWRGVAMIEYKLDSATGVPYLMEINGRFWGSLQLAVDAGVDFPRLLAALAVGQHPTPVRTYRAGVRLRWWWGDVDQLLTRLRRPASALALPPGAPGRLAALGEFLRLWWPGDRNEILRADDPAPFVRETMDWFRRR